MDWLADDLAGIGGHMPPQYGTELNMDSDDGDETPRIRHGRMVSYAETVATSDAYGDSFEDERRPRFQPSIYSASSTGSGSVYTASRSGGAASVLSSLHDDKTKGSRTTSASVAQRAMDAALLGPDDGPQVPPVFTVEHPADPAIASDTHFYHTSAAGAPAVGSIASSATAIASLAAKQPLSSFSEAGDATEVVAQLPCEFAKYTGCKQTFPLHASKAGMDLWINHGIITHLQGVLPRCSACWFCGHKYDIREDEYRKHGVAEASYRKRMNHIARHFRHKETLPDPPRQDKGFEHHLRKFGLWRSPEDEAQLREAAEAGEASGSTSKESSSSAPPPLSFKTVSTKREKPAPQVIVMSRGRRERDEARAFRQQAVLD